MKTVFFISCIALLAGCTDLEEVPSDFREGQNNGVNNGANNGQNNGQNNGENNGFTIGPNNGFTIGPNNGFTIPTDADIIEIFNDTGTDTFLYSGDNCGVANNAVGELFAECGPIFIECPAAIGPGESVTISLIDRTFLTGCDDSRTLSFFGCFYPDFLEKPMNCGSLNQNNWSLDRIEQDLDNTQFISIPIDAFRPNQ